MKGINECPVNKRIAEEIVTTLAAHFPNKTFGVLYFPREDILELDHHQVIRRRMFFGIPLPLIFGETLCQVCTGGGCFVSDKTILPIAQTILGGAQLHPSMSQVVTR